MEGVAFPFPRLVSLVSAQVWHEIGGSAAAAALLASKAQFRNRVLRCAQGAAPKNAKSESRRGAGIARIGDAEQLVADSHHRVGVADAEADFH